MIQKPMVDAVIGAAWAEELRMSKRFIAALIAATALVPAVAVAQDGRGARAAARAEAERDSAVSIGGAARADRGAVREQRQTVRAERQTQRAQAPQRTERPVQRADRQVRRAERQAQRPNQAGGDPGSRYLRQAQAQRLDRQTFRVDRPEANLGAPAERRGEAFAGERRGVRQDYRQDRRDDRQAFRGERREDRQALRNGQVTQQQFRRDRRDDRQDFRRDRAEDRRDFRGQRRSNGGRWNVDRGWNGDAGWGGGNRGGWDRGWRDDRRYDWRGFRQQNRDLYRLPRYYAPRGWGSGYQRFDIGLTLSSILFAQNYWINDPWSYRLPPIDGPFRWVRYYNDALLVDLETGQVVDIEYDIFW